MNISFSIDDDILLALRERAPEFTRDLRFFAALTWYRKGRLSLGKAAELAGDSRLDFIERLRVEQEPIFDYDEDEMATIFADVGKLP